jgi:hypothetical protein
VSTKVGAPKSKRCGYSATFACLPNAKTFLEENTLNLLIRYIMQRSFTNLHKQRNPRILAFVGILTVVEYEYGKS